MTQRNHRTPSNLIDCTNFLTSNTLNADSDSKAMPLYDDINSFKEIVFQSDTEEDFTEGKRLTSLVRESYLKHVRQLLTQNYQVWSDALDNQITVEEKKCLSPSDIEKCVQFLEQRALRSCMIASLYQKSMISLVSSIKQKTKDTMLFETFNRIDDLNLFSSDKNIQTDEENEKISIGCQTANVVTANEKRCRTTSLLDLPLPDPKDVLLSLGSDFIDKNNPTNSSRNSSGKEAVTKVVASVKVSHPVKPVCRVVAKRPSCSDDFASEAKRRKPSIDSDSRSIKVMPEKNRPKEIIDDFDLICMLTDGNKISNNEHKNKIDKVVNCIDVISLGSKTSMDSPVTRKPVVNQGGESDKTKSDENVLSLDDRLIEMGILINEDSNSSSLNSKGPIKSPLNYVKCHRNSWAVEMTAHYCNFARIFLSLSDSKKTKLIQRFSELFGPDDEDNSIELTEQHLSVCRKRTANMVVAGLTPYFASKRIASRLLFKEFAKRVTNSIISRTYIADSRAVNQFITEYFCEHNCVESIEDIDFE